MRFHLVYSGELPSTGNSSRKGDEKARIRKELSPQLEYLWKTHNSLCMLKREAAMPVDKPLHELKWPSSSKFHQMTASSVLVTERQLCEAFPDEFIDLIQPITVGESQFMPLIRKSLDLACELEILFLRQQDPGELISQGGDLDNRVKTLLDALRMPTSDENKKSPAEPGLNHCLLESDALVSDLSIKTDRLLRPNTDRPAEVELVISVKIIVLRVSNYNVCLL